LVVIYESLAVTLVIVAKRLDASRCHLVWR